MNETEQEKTKRWEEESQRFQELMHNIKGKHMASESAIKLLKEREWDVGDSWIMTFPEVNKRGFFTGRDICFLSGGPPGQEPYSVVEWHNEAIRVIDATKDHWQQDIKTPYKLPKGVDPEYVPVWVLAVVKKSDL